MDSEFFRFIVGIDSNVISTDVLIHLINEYLKKNPPCSLSEVEIIEYLRLVDAEIGCINSNEYLMKFLLFSFYTSTQPLKSSTIVKEYMQAFSPFVLHSNHTMIHAKYVEICSMFEYNALFEQFMNDSIVYYLEKASIALKAGEPLPLCILHNLACCYENWLNKASSDVLFSSCRNLIMKLKETPILSNLQTVVTEFFPLLMKIPLDKNQLLIVEQMIETIYDMKTEESCVTVACMLRIVFITIPHYISFSLTQNCLFCLLESDLQGVRKHGLATLRAVISNVRSNHHYYSQYKISEDIWNTYISIFETFDEFPAHLIRSVWDRIELVRVYVMSLQESSLCFPQLTEDWLEILYRRGIRHNNPQVRLFVISSLLTVYIDHNSGELHRFHFSPRFLTEVMIPNLNDSSLFKGDRYGVGYLVTNYLLHYQATDDIVMTELFLGVLKAIRDHVTNPLAVQFLLGAIESSVLPRPPHDFDDNMNRVGGGIGTSGGGGESVTRECVEFVMSGTRVSWCIESRLLIPVMNGLLMTVSTQVSRRVLQSRLMIGLLRIAMRCVKKQNIMSILSVLLLFPWNVVMCEKKMVRERLMEMREMRDCGDLSPSLSTAIIICLQEHSHPSQGRSLLLHLLSSLSLIDGSLLLHYIQQALSLFDTIPTDFYHGCIVASDLLTIVQERIHNPKDSDIPLFQAFFASHSEMQDSVLTDCLSRCECGITAGKEGLVALLVMDIAAAASQRVAVDFCHSSIGLLLSLLLEVRGHSELTNEMRTKWVEYSWRLIRHGIEGLQKDMKERLIEMVCESCEIDSESGINNLLSILNSLLNNIDDQITMVISSKIISTLLSLQETMKFNTENCILFMRVVTHASLTRDVLYQSLIISVSNDLTTSFIKSQCFTHTLIDTLRDDLLLLSSFSPAILTLITLKEVKEDIAVVNPVSSQYARIVMLQFIEGLTPEQLEKPWVKSCLLRLVLSLLKKEESRSGSGHHVQNSEDNGEQVRCWQALCVLSQHLRYFWNDTILSLFRDRFTELCLKDVRSYMELFGLMLSGVCPAVYQEVILPILTDPNPQIQCVPSALMIGLYSIVHPSESYSPSLLSSLSYSLIRATVPWMTASEGINRTVAHVIGYKLLELQQSLADDSLLTSLFAMLNENKRIVAMRKRQQSILDQLSPQTQVTTQALMRSLQNNLNDFIPEMIIDSIREEMDRILSLWYQEDYPGQIPAELKTVLSSHSTMNDFQKKILPWSEMEKDEVTKRHKQNIIVIATYIDKMPNLGGLARTGEIFAIDRLVVKSLKQCSDPVFKSVWPSTSVTADEWVTIEEVSERQLPEYLQGLKREGWSLVGLEQTMSSVDLREAVFPEKIVLILGNEKEGVPSEIIQLLDLCVEIPQYGIIRSLNVHVSGSILLWEYISFRSV